MRIMKNQDDSLKGIWTHISLGMHNCNRTKCMTRTTLKPVGEGESGKFLVSLKKVICIVLNY